MTEGCTTPPSKAKPRAPRKPRKRSKEDTDVLKTLVEKMDSFHALLEKQACLLFPEKMEQSLKPERQEKKRRTK
jgi:hypothetical protein